MNRQNMRKKIVNKKKDKSFYRKHIKITVNF